MNLELMINKSGFLILKASALLLTAMLALSCSTTSAIPDDEQLYCGIKSIDYANYQHNKHFITTQEEIDAALAAAPTGSFFGSSFYRTPLPYGLWIWNAFSNSKDGVGKWLNNSFGTEPVLMSEVNPGLRAAVAQSTLVSNGYFRGTVDYTEQTLKNPKKGKISYTVNMGKLFCLDSISYVNFPIRMDSLIHAADSSAKIKKGDGFSVSSLDEERQRISTLFRNKGYYYYNAGYASYKADTLAIPEKVQLKLQLSDSLNHNVTKQWYIGNTDIYFKKSFMDQARDTVQRRSLTIHFTGKKSPIRPGVVLRDVKLRPRQLYSEENYQTSLNSLSANDTFSMIDFTFTPRDTTASCNILDMAINCVFDKPYDFTIEGNITGKTSSRIGPGAELSFAKRNAFHGGEKLSLNVVGSYEWQTGGSGTVNNVGINSYEYGANLTLELPRLLFLNALNVRNRKGKKHRLWEGTTSTLIKASNNVINRGSYFNRHIMAGELTYYWQPTNTRKHIFSPLILEYDYMNRSSEEFQKILEDNPYLYISMKDQFIPKLRYTFIYTSPVDKLNPITLEATVSESANLLSAAYCIAGQSWTEQNKHLLRNPYAQFLKCEADFTKKWHVGEHTDLVAHVNAGAVWGYGNSETVPYSEQFYVGGANSIRAFTVRTIGPGRYHTTTKGLSYLDQTGDLKFVANLEYRPHLFGNLYGALFLDAGNVWALKNDGIRGSESVIKWKSIFHDMAVATGLGIRYDLDFFVIRVDWGLGLHMPYDTGRSGFFNTSSFKDSQSIHLAVGYPF